jgi:hypothetical protein
MSGLVEGTMRSIAWTSLSVLVGLSVGCAGEAPPGGEDDDPDAGIEMPGPQPTEPVVRSVVGGTFRPLAAFTGIEGRAILVRKLDGTSEVSIALNGGTAGTTYVAHVHIAPCDFQIVAPPAVATATGHYMIDPSQTATVEANELWVNPTTSATGMIVGAATFAHVPREEAISVVVHDPVMGKMACADLVSDEALDAIEFAGTLASFPTAPVGDQGITGTVAAVRRTNSTAFNLTLAGLTAANNYEAHLHNQPCEVITGGGHYMIDPTVPPPAIQANEVWFTVPPGSTTATLPVTAPFGARTDAQSIVAHRLEDNAGVITKVKIACGNLTRTTPIAPFETTATPRALPAAAGMNLSGTALMTRKFNGVTEVAVVMSGLAPNTDYSAHVHNQPCSFEAGGAHYKFDPASTEPTNEIVFALKANAEGEASDSTWSAKLATAEAQSIIVHGTDGSRLACFDLK